MSDRRIARVRSLFFDRAAVIAAMDQANRAALSKAGAFIRRRARSSMRPGGKKNAVAPPGKPPRVHAGQLKQLLFFSYDPSTRSVVIGRN